MLTYNTLFINILYYKNKFIYIYIHESSLNKRVDPYIRGFTSFNRVEFIRVCIV